MESRADQGTKSPSWVTDAEMAKLARLFPGDEHTEMVVHFGLKVTVTSELLFDLM